MKIFESNANSPINFRSNNNTFTQFGGIAEATAANLTLESFACFDKMEFLVFHQSALLLADISPHIRHNPDYVCKEIN